MKKKLQNSGYTIIETMISVAVFMLIVEFGMGALLGANATHQKSKDMRSILDSLSFAMEDISRNIRTGYNYQCYNKTGDPLPTPANLGAPRSCEDGRGIAFETDVGNINSNTDQWVYKIESGKIWKSSNGAQSFIQLTADEINISTVSGFAVLGAESPSNTANRQQPFVTIRFKGTINYKGIITPFSLQTSASQRLIDI